MCVGLPAGRCVCACLPVCVCVSACVCVCLCVCVFRMREVDLGTGRALLIKEHGDFSAIGHKCPHYGAPLVKGESEFRQSSL